MNKYKFFIPVAFILLHIFLHFKAGYVFPMPVGDEVAFYYPSVAVAERNELFAPELNNQRDIFWMPPGFMITTGLIFKVTGASLAMSRHNSLLFTIAAFGVLMVILSLKKSNVFVYILAGLFFVSQHFLVVGNMARMEAMLLLLIFISFLLLYRQKYVLAVSVISLALLFHPNAIYFLLAQLLYSAIELRKQRFKPSWYEYLFMGLTFFCLVWYGIYVLQHWDFFIKDWQFQLSTRNFETFSVLFFRIDQYAFITGFLLLTALAVLKKDRYLIFLLLIAFTFWLARLLGMGWTYGVYNIIAIMLVSAVFLFMLQEWLQNHLQSRPALVVLQGLVLITMVAVLSFVKTINLSTKSMLWQGCVFPDPQVPYVTNEDLSRVKTLVEDSLRTMGVQQPLKAYFIPAGEGIIFNAVQPAWTHILPVFDTLTQPDIYIYHESLYLTDYLKEDIRDLHSKFNLQKSITPIYSRDATERWYFFYPAKHQELYR